MGELPDRVRGGRRPALALTWSKDDGEPENLTGATVTGWLRDLVTGTTRNISGALTVTDGAAGEFRWDFSAEDVGETGTYDVQFNAAFGAGLTPARTYIARWTVQESLG